MKEQNDQFIKDLKKSEMNLYDSDTGRPLKPYKVVDLTAICPDSKQMIIKYTKAKRGLIAQICNMYEPGKDLGVTTHYFLRETSAHHLSKDSVFASFATGAGCNPYKFAVEIYCNV